MKKLLLVSIGLLMVLNVFADTNKRLELIKPDAKGRVIVTPEMITGVQKAKGKTIAPVKENVSDARMKSEKMEFQMVKPPRIDAADAMVKSHAEQQSSRAATRGGGSSSPVFGNQWSQPYQAYGDDTALTQIDMYYSLRSGEFKKFGQEVFTYDAEGSATVTEYTFQNVDGIANKIGNWSVKIPEDATIKQVIVDNDTLNEESVYYIDPVTGEQHYIELYRTVYYNGEMVSMIRKRVDSTGKMVEYGKMESEFDAEGRPVKSIRYSQYTIVDPATGTMSLQLKPYRMTEYEYISDSLKTTTESYMRKDDAGNEYWAYENRITRGKDSDGATYYEYMYVRDTAWVGSNKYTLLEKNVADGSEATETRWSWNSSIKAWQLSGKYYYKYNARENTTLRESYSYSIPLQSFYLTDKRGYEYLGDTLRCAEWSIYYNRPDSLAQLAEPEALAYSGNRNEYADYTQQELGWSSSDIEYLSLPRKYEIYYYLDTKNKKETNWIASSKNEYEYVLVTSIGSKYPEAYVSDSKNYRWNDSVWVETSEYKYGYNEHGDQVLYESYDGGQIVSRQTYEYKYTLVYSYGDSVYERNTVSEKYWRLVNGMLIPSSAYEYDYDDDHNQTLYVYYSSWDTLSNKWLYGSRTEYGFDEYGNQNAVASYEWNSNLSTWIGNNKYSEVYNKRGDLMKRETWYNYSDSVTVWIPSSFEEMKTDEAGNILSNEYYSDWNGESWDYGYKSEWTYSADGLLLSECSYYVYGGQQHGTSREEYEYNAAGQVTQALTYRFDDYDSMDWVPSEKEVFTYADDNSLLDYYTFSYEDSVWRVVKKQVAVVEDGRIVAYMDSVYSSWDDSWTPNYMVAITYDEATGMVTSLSSQWDSYSEQWENDEKDCAIYDSEGRMIYTETYDWVYDYKSDSYYWCGNNKAELGYDDKGDLIMSATYYWDSYDTVWVGNNKREEAYDENGNQILYGSYSWNYERQDWQGYYRDVYAYDSNGFPTLSESYRWDEDEWAWVGSSKTESEYDADGNKIMTAYYYSTDTLGNWIGSDKYINYTKDNISYSESYYWDDVRNDWRGNYKSEYSNSEGYYMSTSYEWDDTEWCWVGSYKDEQTYTENSMETINYFWDRSANVWVKDTKEKKEIIETASSVKSVLTISNWNINDSKWEYTSRESIEDVYNSNGNEEYQLNLIEGYNPVTSWIQTLAIKLVYVYSSLSGVSDIPVDLNISVADGMILVTSADDAAISVASASGTQVTRGTGSVSAAVVPGIYLITVDGKTVKVVVR